MSAEPLAHGLLIRDAMTPGRSLASFAFCLLVTSSCGARTPLDVQTTALEHDDGGHDGSASNDADAMDAGVAAALNGLRWELPCTQDASKPDACETLPSASTSATMGGEPGTIYEVTLRFRGVVELSLYDGGSANGFWQIGGTPPVASTINVYALVVSSPPQTYYVNQGKSGRVAVGLDYSEKISIEAGATVTLRADSRDSDELRNLGAAGQPIVVPDVPPAPGAFDGQFVQMDVVSVVAP